MSKVTIYYNPRCSKCRQSLELVKKQTTNIEINEYLDSPPTPGQLTHIISLGIRAKDLIRTNENEWKQLSLDIDSCSDEELVNAITNHPKIMQRPIVLANGKAIIARPPEKAMEIL